MSSWSICLRPTSELPANASTATAATHPNTAVFQCAALQPPIRPVTLGPFGLRRVLDHTAFHLDSFRFRDQDDVRSGGLRGIAGRRVLVGAVFWWFRGEGTSAPRARGATRSRSTGGRAW